MKKYALLLGLAWMSYGMGYCSDRLNVRSISITPSGAQIDGDLTEIKTPVQKTIPIPDEGYDNNLKFFTDKGFIAVTRLENGDTVLQEPVTNVVTPFSRSIPLSDAAKAFIIQAIQSGEQTFEEVTLFQ